MICVEQSIRDQALTELIDMVVRKQVWFQASEEDHKSVEDSQSGQQAEPTEAFGGKGKVSQKTKNLRMIWSGLFYSK